MERCVPVVSTNNKIKVRNQSHIPDDLFFSILSKLPIKSLKRFGCVRKSWSFLIDNPHFMTLYRNSFLTNDNSYYDDTSLLLHKKIEPQDSDDFHEETFELYSDSGERFENMVKLDWPSIKFDPMYWDNPEYDSGFNILGSCSVHGTLCLLCARQKNIILWNPTTREFKLLPPSPFDYGPNWAVVVDHHGFGYDCVNGDYKVMCHGIVIGEINYSPYMWEIYSLRSNSWRKLDVNMEYKPIGDQVCIDGFSHCLCKSATHNEAYLLSFDLSNEIFLATPIPSDMDDLFHNFSVWIHLVLLNGSIALILNYRDTFTFHISILGDLGVKESWTKIFIVGPLPCLEYPIGVGKKGDMLFRKKDGGLVRFDLNTQKIEELGIIIERFCCKILIHKENLLPFEGADI